MRRCLALCRGSFLLGIAAWAVSQPGQDPLREQCHASGADVAWVPAAAGAAGAVNGRSSRVNCRRASSVSDGAPVLAENTDAEDKPGNDGDEKEFEELYGEWLETMEEARATVFGDPEDEEDLEAALAEVMEDNEEYESLLDDWETVQLSDTWALSVARANRELDRYLRLKWDENGLDHFIHNSGVVMWSGALGLARWMASNPPGLTLQGKRAIELGAGLGLPGVAAASLGAAHVWLQDRLEAPLQKALATAAKNGVDDRLSTLECTWEDLPQKLSSSCERAVSGSCAQGAAEVLLGGDILYNAETSKALADVIGKLLVSSTQVAYIMDPHYRRYRSDFMQRCRGYGLHASEHEVTLWSPSAEEQQDTDFRLLVIRRQ